MNRPVLILLPGLAATATVMQPIADACADHEVVTVELPGHGADRGTAPTLATAVARLHTEIVRHDRPVTLLGWSLGATVTWAYLDRYGTARVNALVCVDQSPRLLGGDSWPHAAFGGLDAAAAREFGRQITEDYAGFAGLLADACFAAGRSPDEDIRQRLIAEAHRCDPHAVRALFEAAVAADFRAVVRGLDLPTLLVHGARSQVYPTRVGDWLADALPRAELTTFDNSGHLPFHEEPGRFIATVRSFLAVPAHIGSCPP